MSDIDVVFKNHSERQPMSVHELHLPLKPRSLFRSFITAGAKGAPSLNTLATFFSNLDETLQS